MPSVNRPLTRNPVVYRLDPSLLLPSFPSAKTLPLFKAFDQSFPLLLLETLPTYLANKCRGPREALLDVMRDWLRSLRNPRR